MSFFSRWRFQSSVISPWQAANRVLAVGVAAILIGGLVLELPFVKNGESKILLEGIDDPLPTGLSALSSAAARPAATYRPLTRRNLFQPLRVAPPVPKAPVAPLPPPAPKIPLSRRAASLRLTGIIPGDPAQAILEDRNRQGARYAVEGDVIDGMKIEKILPDRLILSFEEETMELPL
jgi:hypothetical protein